MILMSHDQPVAVLINANLFDRLLGLSDSEALLRLDLDAETGSRPRRNGSVAVGAGTSAKASATTKKRKQQRVKGSVRASTRRS
jgi:hypothetical protein